MPLARWDAMEACRDSACRGCQAGRSSLGPTCIACCATVQVLASPATCCALPRCAVQFTKEEVVSRLRSQAKASSSLLAEGPAFSDLDLLISDVIQAGQSRLLGSFQSEADAVAAVQTGE